MPPSITECVLVIDPGDRTGWARAVIEDGEIVGVTNGVTPLKDFAVKLYEVAGDYDTLVYETWRLRPDMARKMVGNDFQPAQLIGMIRLMGWVHDGTAIKSLAPSVKSTGRKVMPEILASRLSASTEEHDKDALDLLSYYWWEKYV